MTKNQKIKRIEVLVDEWKEKLLLADWHVHIVIMSKDNENGNCAEISPDYTYLNARLVIYPAFWIHDEYQEEYIVHELCHCHIQGLANIAQDLHDGKFVAPQTITHTVEKLTQRFTRCVLNNK